MIEAVVDIYEEGKEGTPILPDISIFEIDPRERTRLISHPVENGQRVFDNKVIEPFKITVRCGIYKSDTDSIDKIEEMLANRKFSFYSIKAMDGIWHDMALESVSQRQSAEKPHSLDVTMEFQQILFVDPKPAVPSDPANASTKRF